MSIAITYRDFGGAELLTVDTDGSTDNVARLQVGSIDIGLVSGEVYDEISSSINVEDVVFVAFDRRVADAAWAGSPVTRGRFTRGLERLGELVVEMPRRVSEARLDE